MGKRNRIVTAVAGVSLALLLALFIAMAVWLAFLVEPGQCAGCAP